MSPLRLDDVIAIGGGRLDSEDVPAAIPPATLAAVQATLGFMQCVFAAERPNDHCHVRIILTRSDALACRVFQLVDKSCVILVPCGLVGRLRTLSRLLLRYWNRGSDAAFANSPLDEIPPEAWEVPPALSPLFDPKETGEPFWQHLQTLDATLDVDLDPLTAVDVGELMHLGLVFLLFHEWAHVRFRHFAFLEHVSQADPDQINLVRRGLELHADYISGNWAAMLFLHQVGPDVGAETLFRGFMRQSYVWTLLMGIFDSHKKFVGIYQHGDYNHPLIRLEIIRKGAYDYMRMNAAGQTALWHRAELEGWTRAIHAFWDLNVEALSGKFGDLPGGALAYPLQALNYGIGAAAPILQRILNEALQVLERVSNGLQQFNETLGASAAPKAGAEETI